VGRQHSGDSGYCAGTQENRQADKEAVRPAPQKVQRDRGKKVDWIDHSYEEGLLYVGVRFMNGTYFSLQFSPQIVTDGIEFSDMSSGDDKILKVYYRRRGRRLMGEWKAPA